MTLNQTYDEEMWVPWISFSSIIMDDSVRKMTTWTMSLEYGLKCGIASTSIP